VSTVEEIIDIIEKRKNEAIAVILRYKENECDFYLPDDVKARLRKVVLDQINEVNGLSKSLIRTLHDEGVHLNQFYLDKLLAVHEVVVEDGLR